MSPQCSNLKFKIFISNFLLQLCVLPKFHRKMVNMYKFIKDLCEAAPLVVTTGLACKMVRLVSRSRKELDAMTDDSFKIPLTAEPVQEEACMCYGSSSR